VVFVEIFMNGKVLVVRIQGYFELIGIYTSLQYHLANFLC